MPSRHTNHKDTLSDVALTQGGGATARDSTRSVWWNKGTDLQDCGDGVGLCPSDCIFKVECPRHSGVWVACVCEQQQRTTQRTTERTRAIMPSFQVMCVGKGAMRTPNSARQRSVRAVVSVDLPPARVRTTPRVRREHLPSTTPRSCQLVQSQI